MSKLRKSPIALPAPTTAEISAPDAPLPAINADLEIVTGPDMTEFADRVREVQKTIQKKRAHHDQVVLRAKLDIAYDIVEIGWIFLQGKAAIEHGQSGNSNAAKNKSETVSDLNHGFGNWLSATFAEINERSARNYMNAARNLKLTPESTLGDVRALRENNVLADKRLTDLYLPPKGEEEEADAEADAQRAHEEAETRRFEESLYDLTQLGVEKRVFITLPKARLQIIKGQLLDLQRAVAEALKA